MLLKPPHSQILERVFFFSYCIRSKHLFKILKKKQIYNSNEQVRFSFDKLV